jgi:polyferredoxin
VQASSLARRRVSTYREIVDMLWLGLSALVGLGGGVWAVTGYHRRHRGARDVPPSLMRAFAVSIFGPALFLAVAWLVGSLNVVVFISGGVFCGVLCIGLFWWPRFRHRAGRPSLG